MKPRLALIALVLAACGDDAHKGTTFVDSGYMDAQPDARPPYWEPRSGEVGHWDIQLVPPFDLSASRTMYVLPMWALVPAATSVDYGDGAPVAVPKGALAGQIAIQKARRPQPQIICQLGAGSIDLVADPDASKFPGFESSPPDDPTPPKAGSLVGWNTGLGPTWPHRRWLDIRTANQATLVALMAKRFAFAKQLGCDGILPDDIDMFRIVNKAGDGGPYSGTGFVTKDSPATDRLDLGQEQAYYEAIANAAHAAELSVGLRGAWDVLTGALNTTFDWEIADRCGEQMQCDSVREFLQLHKPVLALDFTTNIEGGAQNVGMTCPNQVSSGVLDGIVKNYPPSGASWLSCPDFEAMQGSGSGSGSN